MGSNLDALVPLAYSTGVIGINCSVPQLYQDQYWVPELTSELLSGTIKGHPWYSGSELDCWSIGLVIDPAPGASIHNKNSYH